MDGDPTVLIQLSEGEEGGEEKADDQPIGVNSAPADMRPSSEDYEFDWSWDWREDQPGEQDSDPSVRGEDGQDEPSEADEWVLYIEAYPPAASECALGQQPAMNEKRKWDETTVQNGSKNDAVSELQAGIGEEGERPTSNGQASNGQGGHQDDAQDSEMRQQAHIDEGSSRI
jgi:hypothetical protein